MFEKLDACPSCQSRNFKNSFICKDHAISSQEFAVVKCHDCELLFTSPRPDKDHINQYYESENYISHSDSNKGIINNIYKLVRNYTLKNKVNLINSLQKQSDKTLLDYGCGTGYFPEAAQQNGWQVKGIEPSSDARELAHKKDIDVFSQLDQIPSENLFSVITLWHVLEHVHDLPITLDILKSKLSSNGNLIIAVPNYKSFDAQYYGSYWAAYDVPRHLYHFNQKSMRTLLSRVGLKIVDVRPMVFDAYYVSLLSEKYKSGQSNYLKSFITGYKSNSYAHKTGEYSSLIYIVKTI